MALKLQTAKDRREESSTEEQQLIHAHPPTGKSSTVGKAGMSAWKKPRLCLPRNPPKPSFDPEGEMQAQVGGKVTKKAGSP